MGRRDLWSNASGGLSVLLAQSEELVHDLVFHSSDSDNTCYLQLMSIHIPMMAPGRDKKLRYFLVSGCKWNNIRTVTV